MLCTLKVVSITCSGLTDEVTSFIYMDEEEEKFTLGFWKHHTSCSMKGKREGICLLLYCPELVTITEM